MSYVAIARKWRPTTFADISGQGHVTRTLQNALQLDRVHHAYLFTGARGVGKTTAARVLARALNCAEGPAPEPCDVCDSCVAIGSGNSPDVIEIDGASNNSVEDVRELRDSVRYLPQGGRKKVYIVDEVHMLSRGAFNALLKTLEEPPGHVVFIFATTEPHKIPDTILSRVQRFDFKRMPVPVVAARLRQVCDGEGYGIPDEGLRLIARAGEGSMRDSQSLLDRVVSFAGEQATTEQVADVLGLVDRALLYRMLEGMLKGEADACLAAIDQVHGFGYDLSEFTSEMLELLRNATMVGLSPSSRRYLDVSSDEQQQLDQLAKAVPTDVLVRSFEVMLDVHERVARAPRPRMVLEMAVARLVSIRPARPIDQIVQRLGDLERRLRGSGPRPRGPGGSHGGRRSSGRADDDPEPASSSAPRPDRGVRAQAEGGRAAPRPAPAPRPVLAPRPDPVAEQPALPRTVAASPALRLAPPERLGDSATAEGEVVLPEPAPIPRGADLPARFLAFQSWLQQGGPRYEVWAWDTVVLSAQDGVLRVATPSLFKCRNLQSLPADDRMVTTGLAAYFPQCRRVEIQHVDKGRAPTRREAAAAARQARIDALRAEVEQDEVIRSLCTALGAEISGVLPGDERPLAIGRSSNGQG